MAEKPNDPSLDGTFTWRPRGIASGAVSAGLVALWAWHRWQRSPEVVVLVCAGLVVAFAISSDMRSEVRAQLSSLWGIVSRSARERRVRGRVHHAPAP